MIYDLLTFQVKSPALNLSDFKLCAVSLFRLKGFVWREVDKGLPQITVCRTLSGVVTSRFEQVQSDEKQEPSTKKSV